MIRDSEIDQEIWNLSKLRFFQSEAQFWTVKTITLEIIFTISIGTFCALIYFGQYQRLTFVVAAVAIASAMSILARDKQFKGYLDGYEQGFRDAGYRRLDYYHPEEYAALASILGEINETEERMSKNDWAARHEDIKKGMSNAAHLFQLSKK